MLLQTHPLSRQLTLHLRQNQQWLNRPRDVDWHESSFCLDGHRLYFGILTLGDGTDRLPRNIASKSARYVIAHVSAVLICFQAEA